MIRNRLLMSPQMRACLLMGTWQCIAEEAIDQWWADYVRRQV